MDPGPTSTTGTTTGGQIHFVTPTNRWLGSIPLSTLDPLTLEPLSTYVRPGPSRTKTRKEDEKDDEEAEEEEGEDMKERTTNIAGDPISLILARLQTTPQGCACGCTAPDPPKHSDYYHAQHLLKLLFQTQRVRSKPLKMHLPEFFERFSEDSDESEDDDWYGEGEGGQEQKQEQGHPSDSVVIPIFTDNSSSTKTLIPNQPQPSSSFTQQQQRQKKKKIPRYVHSLIQNRNFRNPLTNTEIDGEPTFFVVLEQGKGGWWHEPWAMAVRPAGVQGFHTLLHQHRHQHQEDGSEKKEDGGERVHGVRKVREGEEERMQLEEEERVQLEKELRKERWRQGRIVNLELEAQREMGWRRWNRSQATFAAEAEIDAEVAEGRGQTNVEGRRKRAGRRMMRLKLGKDIALLEPSECGLRLPRRVRSRSSSLPNMDARHRGEKVSQSSLSFSLSKKKDTSMEKAVANNNRATIDGFRSSIQASAILYDVELEDIGLHQKEQAQEQEQDHEERGGDTETIKQAGSQQQQHQVPGRFCGQRGGRIGKKWRRRLARVHHITAATPSSLPSTSTLATTAASPSEATEGFSFLPWWDPDPQPFQMPSTKLSSFAISTLPEPVAKLFGGTAIYSRVTPAKSDATANPATTDNSSTTTTTGTTTTVTKETPPTGIPKNNTAGCQWVPVNHRDRIAVMIGTSKDFLLFPSFQRLFLRNLSREDFEDRVGRVNRIPCPATAIVVTSGAGGGGVEEQMREQGSRIQEGLQRQQQQREQERREQREQREVDVSAMEEGAGGGGHEAGTTTGRPGRSSWMAWMSPRRRRQRGGRAATDSAAILTTTAVNAPTNLAEHDSRPPLPPSSQSTTAFVTSSSTASSSTSSRSVASAAGDNRIEGEKGSGLGANDNSGLDLSNNANCLQSNSDGNVDTLDEKAAARLDPPPAFQQNNSSPSTTTPMLQRVASESSKETREEEERRWQALEERFLREDYDSSDYSYPSSSDEEDDELALDYDGPYYSSEESDSSDGDDGYEGFGSDDDTGERSRRRRQRGGVRRGGGSRQRWGIRDWLYYLTFCTPHPRTFFTTNTTNSDPTHNGSTGAGGGGRTGSLESRRARRRRLRRERWLRIQQRQQEQESAALHRYLPLVIRRRMTAQNVHRICMVAEFCRFYFTILISIAIMGAIVYSAVHVEASPPHSPSPKATKAPTAAEVEVQAKDLVVPAGGGGGGGGGSLRKTPGQWTASVEVSGRGGGGRVWQGEK